MRPYEESLEGGPLGEERGLLLRVAVVLFPVISRGRTWGQSKSIN